MWIDCGACPGRPTACGDCAVNAFLTLEPPGRTVPAPLDAAERRAVSLFVGLGLVAPAEAEGLLAQVEPAAVAV